MGTINNYGSTITNQSADSINIANQNIHSTATNSNNPTELQSILHALDLMLQQARQATVTSQEENQRICSALSEIKEIMLSDGNKESRLEKMARSMNVLGGFSSTAALCLQIRSMIG